MSVGGFTVLELELEDLLIFESLSGGGLVVCASKAVLVVTRFGSLTSSAVIFVVNHLGSLTSSGDVSAVNRLDTLITLLVSLGVGFSSAKFCQFLMVDWQMCQNNFFFNS